MGMNLPATFKIVELLTPATDSGGRTSTIWASLSKARKATIVVHIAQGAANTVLLTPLQATAIAGTGSKALTNNCPLWLIESAVASDALVRQTDAANYTTSAGTTHKVIVFEIMPAVCMDVANSFCCIGISTGASSASNITEAMLYIEEEYEQATPPTAIA